MKKYIQKKLSALTFWVFFAFLTFAAFFTVAESVEHFGNFVP